MSLPVMAQAGSEILDGGGLSVVYVAVPGGAESQLDCSGGFSSATPVPLGSSRTWTFRLYALPDENPSNDLTIYNVGMENGEQHTAQLSGSFPLSVAPGAYYEFTVTFAPDCYGFFADYINIHTSDPSNPNCRIIIDAVSEKLEGPQLSVIFSHATEEFPFAFQDDTNVLPSAYRPVVPSVEAGEERLVLLEIRNWGIKELDLTDVVWTGPIDPRNEYPINPLVIGERIPSGGQRFFGAFLTDEADCENNEVTATFITNRYNTCPETYNSSTFSFEVVFPDENCEDDDNDDDGGGRGSVKEPKGKSLAGSSSERTWRVYPSVTSTTISVEYPMGETEGSRNYLISNLVGQTVRKGTFAPGSSSGEVDVAKLPVGGYFFLLEGIAKPFRFFRQ